MTCRAAWSAVSWIGTSWPSRTSTKAYRLNPKHAPILVSAAWPGRTGKCDRALADYNEALRLDPGTPRPTCSEPHAAEARPLPGCPDDFERGHPEARGLRHAQSTGLAARDLPAGRHSRRGQGREHGTRACELTQWKDGNLLDTLAAAFAECGRFAEAIEHAQKAETLAPQAIRGHSAASAPVPIPETDPRRGLRRRPGPPPGRLPPGKRKKRR